LAYPRTEQLVAIRCVCLLLFCFGIRQDQLVGVPTLCIAWQSKHDSQTALLASASTRVSICLESASVSKVISCIMHPNWCLLTRQCKPVAAAPCADLLLFQITSGTPISLVLLHTIHTCAFKPGCLISHRVTTGSTPQTARFQMEKTEMVVFILWHLLTTGSTPLTSHSVK